ncbi:hypothetical protein M409DRAFT_61398 [Zasmidium cellare ATCC 36951]|uniref:Uncharacterized protein n=1 Tax=Zasmidium cellare ATCC 36951 TaxID=1080233 RepID=A0A6A6BYY6_ZASCE|nr:uncharacterized protein M409DRAFT_61398 [Zasmidium cellare ATCC 36951]KAF2158739.1 hypothetical protein M409DRAFT_61398 [Zasmidium cellare ATCC 36951]
MPNLSKRKKTAPNLIKAIRRQKILLHPSSYTDAAALLRVNKWKAVLHNDHAQSKSTAWQSRSSKARRALQSVAASCGENVACLCVLSTSITQLGMLRKGDVVELIELLKGLEEELDTDHLSPLAKLLFEQSGSAEKDSVRENGSERSKEQGSEHEKDKGDGEEDGKRREDTSHAALATTYDISGTVLLDFLSAQMHLCPKVVFRNSKTAMPTPTIEIWRPNHVHTKIELSLEAGADFVRFLRTIGSSALLPHPSTQFHPGRVGE